MPILLPELGVEVGRFSLWYVRPGEAVTAGDRVAEILIPGLTIDVAAPADGVLRERLALPGDVVHSGQSLGLIEPPADP
ncbi:lipoyl domain-containing protein [Limnoglobus roseus]|uniref:Lipoyl-binding domain-containing protein n=1 Tax=Limnoglobus roseus TaxID=2598579 RepID=A0A5C1ANF7_9BACT|nr:lipoyl domain-containing protein [Limnoglobus roseus]QEL19677.1 hypothetical protein PX52LOC_06756 [Limnoglobus roseus]